MEEEEIAAVEGLQVFQRTGKQLTQSEETLWLELMHLAFQQPSERTASRIEVRFSANQMLRILKKGTDSKNRAALRDSLNLLGDTRIRVESKKMGLSWTANLIDIATLRTPDDNSIAVYIDRTFLRCFNSGGYTLQNREQRNALKDCPLAQWMHGYFSTHKKPIYIKSIGIKKLAGCQNIRPKTWESNFKEALLRLEKVTGWKCNYYSSTDNLLVVRNLSSDKEKVVPFNVAPARLQNHGATSSANRSC